MSDCFVERIDAMDNLEEQSKQFFSNAKNMKTEQRDIEYDRIKQVLFRFEKWQ